MSEEVFKERDKWKLLMKSLDFFSPFDDEELDALLSASEVNSYSLRDYVIKEANEGYSFYVLLKGTAHIFKKDVFGVKHEIAELGVGDCFGEMAILLEEPRTASVKAGKNCYVFEIEGEQIAKLPIETQMKLFREFAIMLAKRLKISSTK